MDSLLKGKFSSGREGALASKFNYDFKIKTTIRSDALHLFLKVFYVYLSKMYAEVAKISMKRYFELLGVGVLFYYDLKYNR